MEIYEGIQEIHWARQVEVTHWIPIQEYYS